MANAKKSYYDPKKAHEYYMKHRKLKGRKKGRKTIKGLTGDRKKRADELAKDIDKRVDAFNDMVDAKIEEIINAAMEGGQPLTSEQIDGLRKNADKVKEQGAEFYDKMYNKKVEEI